MKGSVPDSVNVLCSNVLTLSHAVAVHVTITDLATRVLRLLFSMNSNMKAITWVSAGAGTLGDG